MASCCVRCRTLLPKRSSLYKADNAYRNAMTLSAEQFLRLETIKMQREVCAGGHCTFVLTDGKITPILDTKR